MSNLFKDLKKNKKKISLIDEKFGEISYSHLVSEAEKVQNKITSNSVALLISDNRSEFVTGYIAFLQKKNVISIIIDQTFSINFILKIISLYKPNYFFCSNKLKDNFKKLVDLNIIYNFQDFSIYRTNYDFHKKMNFKNYLLISTSGTTQNPKFVRLSKENLKDNLKKIIASLRITQKHRTITTMPLAYSYGLSILNSHLLSGASIVLNNKSVIDKNFWMDIKKYQVNSFGGVPELYRYLQRINFEKYISTSIKYLTQAGGKLDEKTLKHIGKICKKKDIKFYVMYGQTEAAPRISCLNWKDFFSKINSIGKPLKGYKIKLVDKNRKIINKTNLKGEIMFLGKNVSLGYANDLNDLKKGDENNKILYTGDLAKKDKQNFFYIVGRKNRIFKLFGKRYDLDDIENFFKKKGIKTRCKIENLKIKINFKSTFDEKKEIESVSNFLGLNKNFIIVSKEFNKTFKDI